MRKFILIGAGGFLGAVCRFAAKNIQIYGYNGSFPINTFIINITGSFILAFLLSTAFELWKTNEDIRIGISTGFLGAYTTFSTFCKEIVILMAQGFLYSAFLYSIASITLGLAAAYSGYAMAKAVSYRLVKSMSYNTNDLDTSSEAEGEVD